MSKNLQNTEIGLRLRAERKRLKLTQSQMAALGGVSLGTQHAYESGARSPDANYLARVGSADVDVPYVVLGRSSEARLLGESEWQVIGELIEIIEKFAADVGEQMPLNVKLHYLRVFYEQHFATQRLDAQNYEATLKLNTA